MKTAIIEELIRHYKGRPLHGWHYGECVAGVLFRKGYVHRIAVEGTVEVARALDVPQEEAHKLVHGNGAPWSGGHTAGDKVATVLSNLLDTGKVDWSV